MEGTMVNGKGLHAYADNSLTGEVVVTGVIGKGSYQCTWNGDWHPEAYDDYSLLAAKLAPTATKLNVTAAGRWDEDWNVIKTKCPGIEIVTEESTAVYTLRTARRGADRVFTTLSGQRIANINTKGVYIIDGKKTVVN